MYAGEILSPSPGENPMVRGLDKMGRVFKRIFALMFPGMNMLFALGLVVLALGGCVRGLGCNRPDGQSTFGRARVQPVERPVAATPSLSQDVSVDLKETTQNLAEQESALARKEGEERTAALCELARLCFLLGEYGEKSGREAHFSKGRTFAEILCREEPRRVEGYYWLALNLAGLAEAGSAGRALGMVPTIIEKLKIAVEIDETYDQAGPHRVLGRIYCEAPCWPLSEGDVKKSLYHLRRAVEIAPDNSTNHLYLAQTFIQLCELKEAHRELQQVLSGTQHATWPAGLQEDQLEALDLLKRCGKAD